jgi:hypothetical protein
MMNWQSEFWKNMSKAKVRGMLLIGGILVFISAFSYRDFFIEFLLIGIIMIAITLLWWKKDLK